MSVWRTPQAPSDFVLRTVHGAFLKRRDGFAHRTYVIWPIPETHRPTVREGLDRLAPLETEGPGPQAYDFASLKAAADTR